MTNGRTGTAIIIISIVVVVVVVVVVVMVTYSIGIGRQGEPPKKTVSLYKLLNIIHMFCIMTIVLIQLGTHSNNSMRE